MMKRTGRISTMNKVKVTDVKTNPGYYFHADEDFREDWDWGKSTTIASKAVSKPAKKFEI